jgi:hypothetical protein
MKNEEIFWLLGTSFLLLLPDGFLGFLTPSVGLARAFLSGAAAMLVATVLSMCCLEVGYPLCVWRPAPTMFGGHCSLWFLLVVGSYWQLLLLIYRNQAQAINSK